MARGPSKTSNGKSVSTLTHEGAARKNIPTAEYQSVAEHLEELHPQQPAVYPRASPLAQGETRERNEDLDPQIVWNGARIRLTKAQARQLLEKGEVEIGDAQLVWRGKDRQDWSDLVVQTPPLYIQEKVHPKAIIDDLVRRTRAKAQEASDAPDLFADFNGLDDPEKRTEFYQHDQHWSNRMILGDSLSVMASLAEREALRGKVQCIYFDPPYGIKFNSNWQVSTQSRDVKDGKQTDISREPEQVKAFRDTWKDGIHSYLTYLRDRLTVARDLLTESGSIFVQIGDENVHRVHSVLDEVFGSQNSGPTISFKTTAGLASDFLAGSTDHIIWYFKNRPSAKFRRLFNKKAVGEEGATQFTLVQSPDGSAITSYEDNEAGQALLKHGWRVLAHDNLTSTGFATTTNYDLLFQGSSYKLAAANTRWKSPPDGMQRLIRANRVMLVGRTARYKRMLEDFPVFPIVDLWTDTGTSGFAEKKVFVVQTNTKVIERCILMTTDPGDLVLDPTCGSGTTAYVAEQWGRRWITIDTSRVALALARTRLMSARYPYYLLADTSEGRRKEQEISGRIQPDAPTLGDIRQGFVYERAPHITLKSIANNPSIDTIWEAWQAKLEPLRETLNKVLGKNWEEWQIPRESGSSWDEGSSKAHQIASDPARPEGERLSALAIIKHNTGRSFTLETLPERPRTPWVAPAEEAHAKWWEARITRQQEIDASIAKAADVELLYDRPYDDKFRVRVAGPFTVESLSPHRVVPADEEELIDLLDADEGKRRRQKQNNPPTDFATMVLEHLRSAGVHQSEKRDTIRFTSLTGWPGEYIGAEGRFMEGETERRAAIFIGPEFGTLGRIDLVAAAREATDARFDALIACAFNFDAHASELSKLGPLPILKAKMNPDLHMSDDLKNTGKGNLFVVFGEPDIDIEPQADGAIAVAVKGIDVFDPNTGDIRSGDTNSIAAWFIDTDYNEESFFVRQAYFLGANDPYKSLKTALQAEVDREAWETLYRAKSRPFPRPETGKIAVKVINHFGDEVMKVFRV
jgi:adenine-specific DNA-methyltransferase